MRYLIVVLALASSLAAQTRSGPFSPVTANRVTRGAGAPTAGLCAAAADVGKVYVRTDAAAASASLYVCANTAAMTYAWEIAEAAGGGGGGTVTSVSGPAWLTWATATTTPTASATTGQASHQVLGTCNALTAFAPCALVLADLPGTVVNATSPGAGIAHFAGATQTVTSSSVVNADIAAATIDLPTKINASLLPAANLPATAVTSAAALGNTQCVTGAAGRGIQTPNANCTIDASGNLATSGTMTSGLGSGVGGATSWVNGTAPSIVANSFGFGAPATITTAQRLVPPDAVAVAHSVMVIAAPASNSSTFAYKAITDCTDTGGNHLNFTQSTDAFSCGTSIPAQYKTLSCQPGLGDGLNAMAAGTYLESTCWNKTGVTVTLTSIQCFTDNAGTSTLNATNGAGTGLLTGAVTCSSTIASGTQSATTTIANNDFIKFTFVADGTSKQSTWVVASAY